MFFFLFLFISFLFFFLNLFFLTFSFFFLILFLLFVQKVAFDLPEKTIQNVIVMKSKQQDLYYQQFIKKENDGVKTSSLVKMQYMRLLCSHPSLVSKKKISSVPSAASFASSTTCSTSSTSSSSSSLMLMNEIDDKDVRHSGKMVALLRLLAEAGIGDGPPSNEEHDEDYTAEENNEKKRKTTEKKKKSKEEENQTFKMYNAPKTGWNHKVIIFTHFKKTIDYLEETMFPKYLNGIKYLRLDGSVQPIHRGTIVQTFNNSADIACLLTTTRTGGIGLNLTSADIVIFLEPDWNPTVDAQAMDRAHRIGQTKKVSVYRLITLGTLEEQIMDVQEFKTKTAKDVLTGVQNSSSSSSSSGSGGGGMRTSRDGGLSTTSLPGMNNVVSVSMSSSSSATNVDEEYELHNIEQFAERLRS
jgi:TATA-binding protein-associated factor